MVSAVRHARLAALFAASASLAGVGVALSGASQAELPAASHHASATPTTTSLVASVKAAITKARSVHFEFSSTSTKGNEHVVADAGLKTGEQKITFGRAWATILVTRSDAYFAGNASGLSTIFGMPSSDIKKVGSKWVDVKSGTSQYTSLEDGATEGALSTSLLPSSSEITSAHVSRGVAAGVATYDLTWKASSSGGDVTEILEVRASGPRLPVAARALQGKQHSLTTFSRWGETVRLKAPTRLIAFTKLPG